MESISEQGMDEELRSLFDMSTTSQWGDDEDGKPELISSQRFALDELGRAVLEKDTYISYSAASPPPRDPFSLFDDRVVPSALRKSPDKKALRIGDVYSSGMPLMPCAKNNLDNIEKDVVNAEPVRSRDKDYKAEQMQLLSKVTNVPDYAERYLMEKRDGDEEEKGYSPSKHKSKGGLMTSKSVPSGLKLGKYKINMEVPSSFWSPQFQSLIRKTKMLRCTKYISETYCVIDIYGIGINGRIFSGGPGKMIIIEAYSTWNSERHLIILTVPMLKEMLAGDEALFRPGNKQKLIDTLISYLYFTYTITPEAMPDPDEASRQSRQSRASRTRGSTAHTAARNASAGRAMTAGTLGASRPVTGYINGEQLGLLEEEDGGGGDEVLNTGRISELSGDGSMTSRQDDVTVMSQEEQEKLTHREARALARQARLNDPIYLGLIPCGVEAPSDLAEWEQLRESRLQQLQQKNETARPSSQGSVHDFQLFEPGSPPGSAQAAIGSAVGAPNSAGGWNFAPQLDGSVSLPADQSDEISVLGTERSQTESARDGTARKSARATATSRSQTSQSSLQKALDDLLPKPDLRVQTVVDIEEPKEIRPDLIGYPATVSQIMRAKADASIGEESALMWKGYGLPTLTQELRVGTHMREKASKLREVKEQERIKKEAAEEATRKAAWLAIPPMKRGFRMSRALFTQGRLVVLRAYIFPHKPTNVVVIGHVVNECKRMMLNLALSTIGKFYGESRPPKQWPPELVDPLLRQALSEVRCVHTGDFLRDGLYSLRIRDTVAFETQLTNLVKEVKLAQAFLDIRATQFDHRQLAWTQGAPEDLHRHRTFPPSRFFFKTLPYPAPTGSSKDLSKDPPIGQYFAMPRRHIGRNRMFQTAMKIQGTPCMCAVYFLRLIPHVIPPKAILKQGDVVPPITDNKKMAWPAFGNVPVPLKKANKIFKAYDAEYHKELPRIKGEKDLWAKMVAEEKAIRDKLAAEAKERERVYIHNQRVAMYQHLQDLKHVLTPEEFRRKYIDSIQNLDANAFKELWSMGNSGVWHHVYLHMLNDKHDLELQEVQRKLRELEAAERAADVERYEKEEKERIRLEEAAAERQRKVHEYRHMMLHAVVKREGEDHDEFAMRRMKEAIAMKKAIGLLEVEDLEAEELAAKKAADEAAGINHEDVGEVAAEDAEEEEEEEEEEEDEDWMDTRNTPERVANDFLAEYAKGFELEMELYFPHEACVDGVTIPPQSIIKHRITREDIYRLVPTFEERFDVLRVGYQCFFDISSEFEIEAMYAKWKALIIRQYFLRDTVRWSLMKPTELAFRKQRIVEESKKVIARKIAEEKAWNGEEEPEPAAGADANAGAEAEDINETENVPSGGEKRSVAKEKAASSPKAEKQPKPDVIDADAGEDGGGSDVDIAEALDHDEEQEEEEEEDDGASFMGEEEGPEHDDDDPSVRSAKPYVPPDPPLSQKAQMQARIRMFEMHSAYSKSCVISKSRETAKA